MNLPKVRRIFKSDTTSQGAARELLQNLFISELLFPSSCLWLISPWVSDINILDNLDGSFSALNPGWGRRPIKLTEVLHRMIVLGSHVRIAVRPIKHNQRFIYRLNTLVDGSGVGSRLTVIQREKLHTKGILGEGFLLSGSMNITYNGVKILEEQLTLDISPDAIAEARIAFSERYGTS